MGRINELMKDKKLFYTALALPIPFILALIAFFIGASSTTLIALISIGLMSTPNAMRIEEPTILASTTTTTIIHV